MVTCSADAINAHVVSMHHDQINTHNGRGAVTIGHDAGHIGVARFVRPYTALFEYERCVSTTLQRTTPNPAEVMSYSYATSDLGAFCACERLGCHVNWVVVVAAVVILAPVVRVSSCMMPPSFLRKQKRLEGSR